MNDTDKLMATLKATEQHAERGWSEAHEQEARAEAAEKRVLELQAEREQLAAENAALKAAFNPEVIPEEAVNAFMDTAILDHDWNDTGEWSWVENETDVIRAVLDALVKPETLDTDAWQREQMAKGVDAAIADAFTDGVPDNRMQFIARMTEFAAQLRNGETV